jgi:hypothetical protein
MIRSVDVILPHVDVSVKRYLKSVSNFLFSGFRINRRPPVFVINICLACLLRSTNKQPAINEALSDGTFCLETHPSLIDTTIRMRHASTKNAYLGFTVALDFCLE